MRHLALSLLIASVATGISFAEVSPTSADIACHAGAYLLPDRTHLVLSPAPDRNDHVNGLRSLMIESGAKGSVDHVEAGWVISSLSPTGGIATIPVVFGSCDATRIRISLSAGSWVWARQLRLHVTETAFEAGGATLHGALILPESGDAHQIVVQVHGSERSSALTFGRWRYIWPALGVGVFIYDKRGTGASQGTYTQNFDALANDAAAAARQARSMLSPRRHEVGLFGTSQGGWVAPLAATRTQADFVLVGYGLAHSPVIEDREQVLQELRAAGYDETVLSHAREVTDATALGISTGFASGVPQIAAMKARYGEEAWFHAIRGEYSGDVLSAPIDQLPALFHQMDVGTSWSYDPVPTLRAVGSPMLWVLAGNDHEAPSTLTLQILSQLRAQLPNLSVIVFPTADHEIQEYVQVEDRRVLLGYSSGYLPLIANWVRTRRASIAGTNAELR